MVKLIKAVQREFELIFGEYERIKLEDSCGWVHPEYRESLKRFRRSDQINPFISSSLAPEEVYADAIAITDPISCTLKILPKVEEVLFSQKKKGGYLFSRKLKPEERGNRIPPRFQNGMVVAERGVRTPTIAAFVENEKSATIVTTYAGSTTFLNTLCSGSMQTQDIDKLKRRCAAAVAFWRKEVELTPKYSYFPHANILSYLMHGDIKPGIEWMDYVGKQLYHGTNPAWLDTITFLAKHYRGIQKEISLHWDAIEEIERDTREYLENRNEMLKAEKEAHCPRLPNEAIYDQARKIGEKLRESSDRGVVLLDVAPRDIVIDQNGDPSFVDMENVRCYDRPLNERERQRQMNVIEKEFKTIGKRAKEQEVEIEQVIEKIGDGYRN